MATCLKVYHPRINKAYQFAHGLGGKAILEATYDCSYRMKSAVALRIGFHVEQSVLDFALVSMGARAFPFT